MGFMPPSPEFPLWMACRVEMLKRRMASSTCLSVATGDKLILAKDSAIRTMASNWLSRSGSNQKNKRSDVPNGNWHSITSVRFIISQILDFASYFDKMTDHLFRSSRTKTWCTFTERLEHIKDHNFDLRSAVADVSSHCLQIKVARTDIGHSVRHVDVDNVARNSLKQLNETYSRE